jgi:hypothetical protein
LSFEDGIGLAIDAEWEYRQGHKTALPTKRAGFTDPKGCVEAIDCRPEHGLDKAKILSLATCGFIDSRHDIVILGKTGALVRVTIYYSQLTPEQWHERIEEKIIVNPPVGPTQTHQPGLRASSRTSCIILFLQRQS